MSVALWTSPAFLAEVHDWVAARLVGTGLTLTGEWDQPHARPWSSAISFETSGGRVWFKVNGHGTGHEASLVRVIDALVPGLVPEVLAHDGERAWSLSRDGGPLLRSVAEPAELWSRWEDVLVRYADAQLALAGHRDAVLATGLPEVSPRTVPGQARQLLDELAGTPVVEGGLAREDTDRLVAVLPQLDAWCDRLAAAPVPDSVQHDDLHSANVCWPGSAQDARIIDWGDASWGCPLGTMLATMNSLAYHAGVYVEGQPITAPEVLRARDAYLEPFTALADRADLVAYVDLARRTGCVGKALAYRAAMLGQPASVHAEHDFPVRDWLLGLLDP